MLEQLCFILRASREALEKTAVLGTLNDCFAQTPNGTFSRRIFLYVS